MANDSGKATERPDPADPWRNPEFMRIRQGTCAGELAVVNGVEGYMSRGDVRFMWEVGAALPPGGIYLEIGALMGLSAILVAKGAIARGNEAARIYCIDIWNWDFEGRSSGERGQNMYDVFEKNIRDCGVAGMIRPLKGHSVEICERFGDGSLDTVFVDGDHTYDGCLRDLEAWYPKLRRSGCFIGHDATPDSGVRRAVADFCRARRLSYTIYVDPMHYIWQIGRPLEGGRS